MKNKKLIGVLEGVLAIVIGVLIAVFGIQTVLDLYFGILFLVLGVIFLTLSVVTLVNTKLLNFGSLFAGFAFAIIGSFVLAKLLSFGVLIGIFVTLVIALGAALIFYGAYVAVKVSTFYGIGQIVVGAVALTMGILYLTVPDFVKVFWIVVGVLIAVYGALTIGLELVGKKK